MEFFSYQRDRQGSTPLRSKMVEQHWAYMDQFAATMIARGRPNFHQRRHPDRQGAHPRSPTSHRSRAFAFEEPGYQAGAYRDVLLRRWQDSLGRTMWDFGGGRADNDFYLVLGFTLEPASDAAEPSLRDELVASG